ncbi:MAG TPA: hypothetical protein VG992_01540 [Candidatus Saccharimonadales bacterium]|nr:hypothetical protein [Candidatus Saccharimonadales bacterium]
MVWPTDPTQIEDIPMHEGELAAVMLSPEVEGMVCRFVKQHAAVLEHLTRGDQEHERALGSMLMTMAHRTTRVTKLENGIEI